MPGKPDRIRVACVRAIPVAGDLAANWATFEALAGRAKRRGADLCISPECFLDGYAVAHVHWSRRQLLKAGAVAARQYLPRLKALAAELQIMLLFGMTYASGKSVHNSAFLIGSDGKAIGRYDKTHLQNHDLRYDPGRRLPVFDTPLGTVGIMICADRRWPEVARALRLQGARLLLNPTYGMRHMANTGWMRTRSYENECWICFVHPTLSLITNPAGNIHARRSGTKPGLLVSEVDLSKCRARMLGSRRPELYGPITALPKRRADNASAAPTPRSAARRGDS